MNEAVETASKVGINAPLSSRSKEVYKEVVRKGYGEKDFSIVYDLLRKKEIWLFILLLQHDFIGKGKFYNNIYSGFTIIITVSFVIH